jgi:hypothetical protein
MMEEITDVDDPFLEEIMLLAMNDQKSQVIKFRKRRGRGTSAVGSRYQTMTGEDCNRLRRPSVS